MLRQYRTADVEAVMEVGRATAGKCLGQYKRAHVEVAMEVGRALEGDASDNTGERL